MPWNQQASETEERRWWNELTLLADANRIRQFYERYAAYLEDCVRRTRTPMSPSRSVLWKMAKAASRLMENPDA